jgi:xanthine dehydrogenase small subunit
MMPDTYRSKVRFLLGWEPVEVDVGDVHQTVLQYLRTEAHLTGSKEGCAEGDCGACSVIVGECVNGATNYRAVNGCILFLPGLDGKQILTVEHMDLGDLHPVQSAMVDLHGAQCGFCTPGIIMSLIAHQLNEGGQERFQIDNALAGNLCRCTGYGPIIDAAKMALSSPVSAEWSDALGRSQKQLIDWARDDQVLSIENDNGRYIAPTSSAQLNTILADCPDATIVAGATDVGLWVTKHGRRLDPIVSLGAVRDIKNITEADDHIEIGAGVTYAEAEVALSALSESLGELVRRIGSTQVRNSGTVCGNIANGSPIGDMPPALIALGATLVLSSAGGRRELPLEDYFIEYGKQDRRAGEFVFSVRIPKPSARFRCYKISKRFDQDISSVLGAFQVEIKGDKVVSAKVAFGGMAATPKRATGCEAALVGAEWTSETIDRAKAALDQDFTPMTDARASKSYRSLAARNLLERFFVESQNPGMTLELADRRQIDGVVEVRHG